MPGPLFDEWIAKRYATLWPELFDPAVVEPAVSFLAGPGVRDRRRPRVRHRYGTHRHTAEPAGRTACTGSSFPPRWPPQLRAQPGGSDIGLTIGDFATATAGGPFALVYLLRNTITNLITQDEQVQAFRNAATHLEPGGCFVVENYVPELRRLPPGETTRIFTATPDHLGFEDYEFASQIAVSRHYWAIEGRLRTFSSPHRYVVAFRVGPHGPARRNDPPRAVVRLPPCALHRREPQPRLGLGEAWPRLIVSAPRARRAVTSSHSSRARPSSTSARPTGCSTLPTAIFAGMPCASLSSSCLLSNQACASAGDPLNRCAVPSSSMISAVAGPSAGGGGDAGVPRPAAVAEHEQRGAGDQRDDAEEDGEDGTDRPPDEVHAEILASSVPRDPAFRRGLGSGIDRVDARAGGCAGRLDQRVEHGQRNLVDPRGVPLLGDRAVGERRRPQRGKHGGERMQHKADPEGGKLGVGQAAAAGPGLGRLTTSGTPGSSARSRPRSSAPGHPPEGPRPRRRPHTPGTARSSRQGCPHRPARPA